MQETPPIPGVSIRRRLAVGGMAELFLADETLADGTLRPCVIKRLLPGAGAEAERLFEREALVLAALAMLDNPHIVRLYRSGPGWLLLEWVDGIDLATLLEHRRRRGRPLPVGAALAVAVALARALEALGQALDDEGKPLGLVHRDVHPGNVLLGRDGSVKLADLGVVGITDAPTQVGLKGTLTWMAPEQLRRGETSPASDLFSAGLVAYEAFTGQPSRPVGAAGLAELLAARSGPLPSPDALRPELGPELAAAISAPLALDPAARPPVSQWCEALVAAAGPATPEPALLAQLVADSGPRPVASSSRTFVAGGAGAATGVERGAATPSEPVAGRSRWAWITAIVAILAAGGLGLWGALDGAATQPEITDATSPTLLFPLPDADAREGGPEEARDEPADAVADAAADSTGGPAETTSGSDGVASASAETEPAEVTNAGTRRPPRRDTRVVAAAKPRRVRVVSTGGPLHVSGGGVRGLAPYLSPPLEPSAALALRLTGGQTPMQAVVRVRMRQDRLIASIGAAAGEVFDVNCRGRTAAQTPLFGLPVPAAGLSCRLEASDGRNMAFVLSDVGE